MFNNRGTRKHKVTNFIERNLASEMSIINLLKTSFSLSRKEVISSAWLRTIFIGSPLREVDQEVEIEKLPDPPLSECLRYMKSKAYKITYGSDPVWKTYVRNFKGGIPPRTRKTCLSFNRVYITGSPCPICRDIYLKPHYLNVDLIKQFISPYGGNIIDSKVTGVCQRQHFNIVVAIEKAKNYGLLTFYIPHRHYNYEFYNK